MSDPGAPRQPVFYDERQRRWSWLLRLSLLALVLGLIAATAFVSSVITKPLLPRDVLPKLSAVKESENPNAGLTDRQYAQRQFLDARERWRLEREVRREVRALARAADRGGRGARRRGARAGQRAGAAPIAAGFYANWEDSSLASLEQHVGELTHLLPCWLRITADGAGVVDIRVAEDSARAEPLARANGVQLLPVVSNYLPRSAGDEEGHWDSAAVHRLIASPQIRRGFVCRLRDLLLVRKWQGINVDFEEMPIGDRALLVAFARDLYEALHPAGLLVTLDLQLDDDAFDLQGLAAWSDFVIPMVYDEHSPGDASGAGSIASVGWTRQQLARIFAVVPASKVIVGLANYAYDWQEGDRREAAALSCEMATVQAEESLDPEDPTIARVEIDRGSLTPFYRYSGDDDKAHVVWMLDAATAYNQWTLARRYRPAGAALWSLGSEDPGVWQVIGRRGIGRELGRRIDEGLLNAVQYQGSNGVDFEGEGELLEVVSEPSEGRRVLRRDAKTGLIGGESYLSYPSSYVVRRYGHKPKCRVISFDDGPDARWTPAILDILKREGVRATFFIVGSQAAKYPDILARIWREGHEIGDHTFWHPNLNHCSSERILLEITTTQRLIESLTGHTTTLFRPPYAIDTEPRTGEDLRAIVQASRWHFLAVGEGIDPQDWNPDLRGPHGETGAQRIVEDVWQQRDAGNILLLHDGGGDRAASVEALPQIIRRFKAAGDRFVGVADLRGLSRDEMFPAVSGWDSRMVGADRVVFGISYLVRRLLMTAFALSIVLGISRQALMAGLALLQWRRERARIAEAAPTSGLFASVVIAAYNEAAVIERTVSAVLASEYADLEVIVVDDGSDDATSEVVRRAFGDDARVTCLTQPNGGKATAVNHGIGAARGEVIVALDADTLFTPETVGRLARHFADERVGAVAGNVRVGNPQGILTKWQSLEYITSQNFDRRAYDLLNCITVVPGAVGAWRASAVAAAGGCSSDTLAEDMDLTWTIRRLGWRVANDSSALAYTEAPETLRSLSQQRFRWAFGTLQNLWKHRGNLLRQDVFGWVAMPSLWLYQVLFPASSPVMDLAIIWAVAAGGLAHVAAYYVLMFGVELAGASLAVWMDRGNPRLLGWLFFQRFVYRQLMYYVILKSLLTAVRGAAVGWSKLERRNTARLGP